MILRPSTTTELAIMRVVPSMVVPILLLAILIQKQRLMTVLASTVHASVVQMKMQPIMIQRRPLITHLAITLDALSLQLVIMIQQHLRMTVAASTVHVLVAWWKMRATLILKLRSLIMLHVISQRMNTIAMATVWLMPMKMASAMHSR